MSARRCQRRHYQRNEELVLCASDRAVTLPHARPHSQLGWRTPSEFAITRAGIWRCAMPKAPRQLPSLPPPNQASPPAGANSDWIKLGGKVTLTAGRLGISIGMTLQVAGCARTWWTVRQLSIRPNCWRKRNRPNRFACRDSARTVDSFYRPGATHLARGQLPLHDSLKPVGGH